MVYKIVIEIWEAYAKEMNEPRDGVYGLLNTFYSSLCNQEELSRIH